MVGWRVILSLAGISLHMCLFSQHMDNSTPVHFSTSFSEGKPMPDRSVYLRKDQMLFLPLQNWSNMTNLPAGHKMMTLGKGGIARTVFVPAINRLAFIIGCSHVSLGDLQLKWLNQHIPPFLPPRLLCPKHIVQ